MKRVLILVVCLVAGCQGQHGGSGAMATAKVELPEYRKVVLDNGLTLLLMEQHEVPLVDFHYIVKSGAMLDAEGKKGQAHLTALLLQKGSAKHSAEELALELDSLGASLNTGTSDDCGEGSAQFMAKDAQRGLELLAEVLRTPAFSEEELGKAIKQQVNWVKSLRDYPESLAQRCFSERVFGAHPYGRLTSGYEQTLPRITREDVVAFHREHYVPNNMILAVVGDFDSGEMEKMLRGALGDWEKKELPLRKLPAVKELEGRHVLLVDKADSTQTYFRIGSVGIPHNTPDAPYLDVVNTVFGGRFSAMLMVELRAKRGLTYGIYSDFERYALGGSFVIFSYTATETTEQAMDLTLACLDRLHREGISEADLASGKAYVRGTSPRKLETSGQLAGRIATYEFLGRPANFLSDYFAKVDAMTLEDARRVIETYYPKDPNLIVMVGKAEQIRGIAKKYGGTFEEKKHTDEGF